MADLGGLLSGMDPEELRRQIAAMTAAFAPSADEKQAAKMRGIADFGLNLMANSYKPLGVAVGGSGQVGIQGRDNYLQQASQQRQQGMQGVGAMLSLQNQMQAMKDDAAMRQASVGFASRFGGGMPAPGTPAADPAAPQQLAGPGMDAPAPTAAPAAPPTVLPAHTRQQRVQELNNYGDYWMEAAQGNPKGQAKAQLYYDQAQKLAEIKETRTVTDAAGKRTLVNVYKDGAVEAVPGGYAPDAEKAHFLDTGAAVGAVDPFTGQPIKGGGLYNKMPTPGERMTDARAREIHADAQGTDAATSVIGPDAINNAAARYNIDGTLPPMGLGKVGAQIRSVILNRAAELAGQSGLSADDQRIQQIGNKANTASLSKLGQQATMVGAFEKTFNKNADLVMEFSQKVDRTGVPIVNKWVNAGKRAVTGDPELSAFDVAVKSATNEYTKIISGSMGNTVLAEGEVKKVEAMLNAAQTPAQVKEVITFMKRETQNRMSGFKEQDKELRDRMRGKSAADSSSGWSIKKVE